LSQHKELQDMSHEVLLFCCWLIGLNLLPECILVNVLCSRIWARAVKISINAYLLSKILNFVHTCCPNFYWSILAV
jgi:hypothetical protein